MSSPDANKQFELGMAGLARQWRREPGLFFCARYLPSLRGWLGMPNEKL